MGPTSYVSFPVTHKVFYELWPHFQADLKNLNFFYDSGHFFGSTKILFLQNYFDVALEYFLCSSVA